MREQCMQALNDMEAIFRCLEHQVPKPQVVPHREGTALRYAEKSVEQAMIQKLARYLSGLNASDLLLLSGFVQEQAVLLRTLDEIEEDILFLALSVKDSLSDSATLRDYHSAFWEEEFDEDKPIIDNAKDRVQVKRKKVRSYINRKLTENGGPDQNKAGPVIFQTNSGYLHAASPFIMEMCEGPCRTFMISGLLGTHRVGEHAKGIWNYFYRGLTSVALVAVAFRDQSAVNSAYDALARFEHSSGTDYMAGARTSS